jgi:hypothetical protein
VAARGFREGVLGAIQGAFSYAGSGLRARPCHHWPIMGEELLTEGDAVSSTVELVLGCSPYETF